MARKIRLLDEATINKIAAGEVIENSASIVKELYQNSLDAGATEISIETRGAGRILVRVTDNGSGMNEEDALLSLERHATSKLASFDDLNTLSTMGFRGEALPSIASISHLSLFTAENSEKGHFIKVEGGKFLFSKKVPMQKGTRVEIENLFYNVPVRKRFLSSPEKEEREIVKMAEWLALASPHIKISLTQNEKPIFSRPIESFYDRVFAFMGPSLKKELIEIDFKKDKRAIHGLISTPLFHRGTKSHQYLFINGRPLISPFCAKIIREAYGTLLPEGRFPLFFLHLELPKEEVDINVHPQKTEVRFFREQEIRFFLLEAVGKTVARERTPYPVDWALSSLPLQKSSPPQEEWKWIAPENSTKSYVPETFVDPTIKLIGTTPGFILCQKEGSTLLIIDQKRAHSRILFEAELTPAEPPPVFTTPLIVPFTFSFDKEGAKRLLSHIPSLKSAGFSLREFGPTTFLLEEHPAGLTEEGCRTLFETLIEEGESALFRGPSDKERVQKARLFSLSDRAHLTINEAEILIKALFRCKESALSPDGKSISQEVPMRDLFS